LVWHFLFFKRGGYLEESQDLKVWRKTEEFEYGTINGRWKIIKLLDKRN